MNKKDVIIILGGGITEDGRLSDLSKSRTEKGFELFKMNLANNIIVSGKWSFMLDNAPRSTEAEVMKSYLCSLGINEGNIFIDKESTDTIGNAYYIKQIMSGKNWTNAIIITSDFHIERTKYIFSKIFNEKLFSFIYVEAPSNLTDKEYNEKINHENKVLDFTKKWIDKIESGNDYQIKSFLFQDHPGYAKNPTITRQRLLDLLK